jgi:phosphoglycerol transferase MdoB-like AlkP superfamily enzyme
MNKEEAFRIFKRITNYLLLTVGIVILINRNKLSEETNNLFDIIHIDPLFILTPLMILVSIFIMKRKKRWKNLSLLDTTAIRVALMMTVLLIIFSIWRLIALLF